MSKPQRDPRVSNSLFSAWNFLIFFVLVAFIVSNCFLLFLSGLKLPKEQLIHSAGLTFANVIFLSFLCTMIDGVRRKWMIERPVRRILVATQQITAGDYSARIKPLHTVGRQDEFDVMIGDFNLMAQELAGTELLRTDFISNVSHELKTPLAVIQNYATLLKTPDLSEERRIAYAQTVESSTRRLTALITNILKLNKLENQQIFPVAARYDLGEQLCECLLQYEGAWVEKDLEIESDIAPDVYVQADRELLSLVWNNLFSNAIKFTESGGTVALRLAVENGWAVVSVTDTGCGIDAETGKHIFEKFYQGDTSHAVQGNGLGLALVKRVVEITGGEITVQSAPGQGSTFTVKLKAEAKNAKKAENDPIGK